MIEVWGMNHRSAAVAVREKLSVAPNELAGELAAVRSFTGARETVILSTCNRVEIYTAGAGAVPGSAVPAYLSLRRGVERGELARHLYHWRGVEAVRHLFRVVTSLDSMIVGEAQIFGQVREAYRAAVDAGCAGESFRRLFTAAFAAGREVRATTRIGAGAVSVSSMCITLALDLFGSLEGRAVLVVGAGHNGETTVRHLVSRGIGPVIVANRTYERAVELAAEFNGAAVHFEKLYEAMEGADLVVTSTGAPHFVVHAAGVAAVMRRRSSPLLFIDIAVPRDVEPAVGMIGNVHLYNIDDLDRLRERNLRERRAAARLAERIVEEHAAAFGLTVPGTAGPAPRGETSLPGELRA